MAARTATSPSSTPTTTCTRRRTPSPGTCPSSTRARSTTSTCTAGRRSSSAGTISEYIPNPTFDVVARPGRPGGVLPQRQPRGQELPRAHRRADEVPSRRSAEPEPRLELMDELGVDRTLMFPTLASLLEERMRDDPELIHAVIHSLNQWLLRRVDVQLRGPHLHHAGHHAADRREGDRGARVVRRARRQGGAHPARAGARLPRLALVRATRSSTRSGSGSSRPASSWRCTPPTAATPATRATGPGPQEMLPFRLDAVPA